MSSSRVNLIMRSFRDEFPSCWSFCRNNNQKACNVRESNPGLPRGRREFYHWTNVAWCMAKLFITIILLIKLFFDNNIKKAMSEWFVVLIYRNKKGFKLYKKVCLPEWSRGRTGGADGHSSVRRSLNWSRLKCPDPFCVWAHFWGMRAGCQHFSAPRKAALESPSVARRAGLWGAARTSPQPRPARKRTRSLWSSSRRSNKIRFAILSDECFNQSREKQIHVTSSTQSSLVYTLSGLPVGYLLKCPLA